MVHVLLSVCLGVTAKDRLAAAIGPLALSSGFEWFLTGYAVVSLSLSLILLFWVSSGHKRIELRLNRELADSVAAIDKLQQKDDELRAANEQLRQRIAELSAKLQDVPETVTGVTNT
jgi:hypothetical protein